MAHAAQTVRIEVILEHRRPSSLIGGAKPLGATVVADDDRSSVAISGTPTQVDATRNFIKLMDVPRRSLFFRVTVNSPADHLTWDVDAHLVSGQRWRTSDDETDSEIVMAPRVDAAGRLVVSLAASCHGVKLTTSMRLDKGSSQTLAFGKQLVQMIRVDAAGKAEVSEHGLALPTVTVRYVGG